MRVLTLSELQQTYKEWSREDEEQIAPVAANPFIPPIAGRDGKSAIFKIMPSLIGG